MPEGEQTSLFRADKRPTVKIIRKQMKDEVNRDK
jgi:hypothetical protein